VRRCGPTEWHIRFHLFSFFLFRFR
jgi:hypothetical protein